MPSRWREAVASVQRYHKGWEYRLWTDALIDDYVRTKHPRFYPVFAGMNRHIMRVDVFRYVLMHDIGGLYCDLDYEFVRPYDYGDASIVLSLEYDVAFGDPVDQVANYLFASVPGHPFWRDVLDNLQQHPPHAAESTDVCLVTGPWYLTGMYFKNRSRYDGVRLTAEARVQPAPHPRPARAQVLREQRDHVRVPLRLGLVARPAELRLSKGEGREAVRPQACAADSADRRVVSAR